MACSIFSTLSVLWLSSLCVNAATQSSGIRRRAKHGEQVRLPSPEASTILAASPVQSPAAIEWNATYGEYVAELMNETLDGDFAEWNQTLDGDYFDVDFVVSLNATFDLDSEEELDQTFDGDFEAGSNETLDNMSDDGVGGDHQDEGEGDGRRRLEDVFSPASSPLEMMNETFDGDYAAGWNETFDDDGDSWGDLNETFDGDFASGRNETFDHGTMIASVVTLKTRRKMTVAEKCKVSLLLSLKHLH